MRCKVVPAPDVLQPPPYVSPAPANAGPTPADLERDQRLCTRLHNLTGAK